MQIIRCIRGRYFTRICLSLQFIGSSMSPCSPLCVLGIFQAEKKSELFAFYSLFAPYKDLVSHANTWQHAPAFAVQQWYCCTLCTALPCAIFWLFPLLLDRLPWWGLLCLQDHCNRGND